MGRAHYDRGGRGGGAGGGIDLSLSTPTRAAARAEEAQPSSSASPAPSSSSSASSSASSSSTSSPGLGADRRFGLGCLRCGRKSGETWLCHDLPAETVAYSRFSDKSNRGYLGFRAALAIYWVFITILAGTLTAKDIKVPEGFGYNNQYGATYFLYVTYWTCLLQAIYLLAALAAAVYPAQRHLYRAAWVLRTIAAPAACLVALLYWSLIFPATGVTDYVDASIHGTNAAVMLLDLAVSRLPIYARHFYMPFIYTLVYSVFNAAYVGAGGRDSHGENHIYEVLNYKPLGPSLMLLGGVLFVALPLIYSALLVWARLFLRLSGTLADVQPDHELLTPEPVSSDNKVPTSSGGGSSSTVSSLNAQAAALVSPTSLKLMEAEMGAGLDSEGDGQRHLHHRPPHHHHHGPVKIA